MQDYLKDKFDKTCKKFEKKKNASKVSWENLCRITLTAVILFNRRSEEAQLLEMNT